MRPSTAIVCVFLLLGFLLPAVAIAQPATAPVRKTENLILVTFDGMRHQEVFNGADASLFDGRLGGISDLESIRAEFHSDTRENRRRILLPFFWNVVAKKGQVFGDIAANSPAHVTNGRRFSYPGYNELLCGFPDHRIDSNDKIPNPNVTVLEWLHRKPEYSGKIAVYGVWDVFPYILNIPRSKLQISMSWERIREGALNEDERHLDELLRLMPQVWATEAQDYIAMYGAIRYLKEKKPKVMYIQVGETDEWAHGRRYDAYLQSAIYTDRFLERLWQTVESMPQYAGKTTLLITTDHGRGNTPADWTNHGSKWVGSDNVWMAVMGPDTPALGVRKNTPVKQCQVAATVAALLGEDYCAEVSRAAPGLPGVAGKN